MSISLGHVAEQVEGLKATINEVLAMNAGMHDMLAALIATHPDPKSLLHAFNESAPALGRPAAAAEAPVEHAERYRAVFRTLLQTGG